MIAVILASALTLPNPTLTPGATQPLAKAAVCATKWGKDVRHVTEAMKVEIAKSYGLKRTAVVGYGKGPCCEYDHLISRELGGADVVSNLWPQRWVDAKKKDQLENRLHILVCRGDLSLTEAQHVIRTDWVAAFDTYITKGTK